MEKKRMNSEKKKNMLAKERVKNVKKKKAAIELDLLAWAVLAVIVFVISVIVIIKLQKGGGNLIDLVKDIFRFKK